MEKNDIVYTLDFTIPKGSIGDSGIKGPRGITGPLGEIGPVNNQEPMIFINFKNTNQEGKLEIENFFTSNNTIFRILNNEIYLEETGYYEFIISGLLTEEIKSNRARIILKSTLQDDTNIENILTIYLSDRKEEIIFSYNKIKKYNQLSKINVTLIKSTDSNAQEQGVILIIKKLPFS